MTEKDKHEDKHAAPPPAKEPPHKEQEAKPPILAGGIKGATPTESTALPPEAYMTEQEKAALKETPAAKKETK